MLLRVSWSIQSGAGKYGIRKMVATEPTHIGLHGRVQKAMGRSVGFQTCQTTPFFARVFTSQNGYV